MADHVIPDPTALDVAMDAELIDELGRRYPSVVVIVAGPVKGKKGTGEEGATVYHRGGFFAAVGLAHQGMAYFRSQIKK